jgi:hypothetical protein
MTGSTIRSDLSSLSASHASKNRKRRDEKSVEGALPKTRSEENTASTPSNKKSEENTAGVSPKKRSDEKPAEAASSKRKNEEKTTEAGPASRKRKEEEPAKEVRLSSVVARVERTTHDRTHGSRPDSYSSFSGGNCWRNEHYNPEVASHKFADNRSSTSEDKKDRREPPKAGGVYISNEDMEYFRTLKEQVRRKCRT